MGENMRILSITAQKPSSTGSGVYLTEVVKALAAEGHQQAVVAGITSEDHPEFPENTAFYPVYYGTEELPFPVAGMSDEMPYTSTRYCDFTEPMTQKFKNAFFEENPPGCDRSQSGSDSLSSSLSAYSIGAGEFPGPDGLRVLS